MRRLSAAFAAVVVVVWAAIGSAADVEIVKKGGGKLPCELSALEVSGGNGAVLFRRTLENDLLLSGWFTVSPGEPGTIDVAGQCRESRGRVDVRCEVRNRATDKRYFSNRYGESVGDASLLAHRVADDIVAAVKGVKGIASTQILMVGAVGGKKDVYLCDADGARVMRVTRDEAVCLSPAWAPDAGSFVYTSFCQGFPDVYRVDLGKSTRVRLVKFPGLNAGGAISPDGRRLALTLSKDGNPDLYVMALADRALTRITRTPRAAEASPTWSPDGKQIVYVSDESGQPQLYSTGVGGGRGKLVSLHGRENVSPDWGVGGWIACSRRKARGSRYDICILNPATGESQVLTPGDADYESPSWAPDGRHIVCARTAGHHSDLYIVDTMGDAPVRLTRMAGDWYSPSWSSE